MTAKEYLSQAYKLDRDIEITLAKADTMRKSLYGRGIQSGESSQNIAGDSIGKAVAKVIDYELKAEKMIDELVDLRIEIENAIKSVPIPLYQEVLERRYLLYQPFESGYDKKNGEYIKGIAESMNYSERQIYRIHGIALQQIDVSECQ